MSSNRTKDEDASPFNELVTLEQQWIPITAENEDVLPSFADIKANTMRDLYGVGGHDKSPKGSVDVAIRPLVSLLNIHPSFATLSSCSGRIALFDPHMKNGTTQDDTSDHSSPTGTERGTEGSGKGHGRWLLASHEPVKPTSLASLLEEPGESSEVLMFKHEPLLLHVAASSLINGRKLLSLALQLGFRESGLVVTPQRVTVAVRGHSLSLCVPLARRGPLRPSDEYLEMLATQANQRMRANQEKLKRLQQQVQDELFCPTPKTLHATVQSLPPLNLWGHAAIAARVGSVRSEYDVDVFVFGGYGQGPNITNGSAKGGNSGGRRCCRSNHVYCLSRRGDVFEDQWRKITLKPVSEDQNQPRVHELIGVEAVRVDFSAREGLGACLLPINITAIQVVALFGGRASPGKPFNDLLLFVTDRKIEDPSFIKPLDIRGEFPEPRWGHSFTALSGKGGSRDEGGSVAVLIGGRNEQNSLGSVHILSLSAIDPSGNGSRHFYWTRLELDGFPAQFNHTTTVVEDDLVLVFGGLTDPNDLLECFSNSYRPTHKRSQKRSFAISAFCIAFGCNTTVGKVSVVKASGQKNGMRHGAASCVLTVPDASGTTVTLIALTGGVPFNASDTESLVWYQLKSTESKIDLVSRSDVEIAAAETIDVGAMVHHCCVPLFSPENFADMVLIGGGVSSFAFGASFSGCRHVRLSFVEAARKPIKEAVNSGPTRTQTKHSTEIKDQITSVLYVTTGNAKDLKTALEESEYLDKNHRMTKADGSVLENPANHIAVPVTNECLTALEEQNEQPVWYSLVVAKGKQHVPLSSALLGRQKK